MAAAAVLALGLFVLRALEPEAPRERADLGGACALAPVGAVEDFDLFRWRLDLSLGGHYVVTAVPIGPEGEAQGELRSGRLTSSRWIPPADERARWRRIRWSVASFRRGAREPERRLSAVEAWIEE